MTGWITGLAVAGWLGILTSISPCPLATNIAAVSYLGRHLHSRRMAVAGAVIYAFGRAGVYIAIGLAIAWGLSSAPELSTFLQANIGPFVGPVLILVALVLLEWIQLPLDFGLAGQATANRMARWGLAGEFLLGALFALTFCPVSAALFFGALLPLALAGSGPLPYLVLYGLGTALPVAVIAVGIAFGAKGTPRLIAAIQSSQKFLRKGTASIILLVGIYLTLTLSLGLDRI
jgi:cytochrome c-type biogenesis protein